MRKELWENHEIQVKNQKRGLVVEQLNQPVSKLHCLWYSDYTENISSSYLFNLSAFFKTKDIYYNKKFYSNGPVMLFKSKYMCQIQENSEWMEDLTISTVE